METETISFDDLCTKVNVKIAKILRLRDKGEQARLADAIEVPYSTLSAALMGKREGPASYEALEKLSSYLDGLSNQM